MEKLNFKCINQHAPQGYVHNFEFPIRIWKNTPGGKARGVVIMINGFLEGLIRSRGGQIKGDLIYDVIATKLIQDNFCSILLPLPFHFERSLDFSDGFAPLSRLNKANGGNGAFLYRGGYTQIRADLIQLVKQLRSQPSDSNLAENFELHLLGYSIGGALALGLFLDDDEHIDTIPFFDSISILLSNYNIASITSQQIDEYESFRSIGLTGEMWTRFLADLDKNKDQIPDFLKFILWGDSVELVAQKLKTVYSNHNAAQATRLMFLNGLQDPLFPPNSLIQRNNNIRILVDKYVNQPFIKTIMIQSGHDMIQNRHSIANEVLSFVGNNQIN